MVDRCRAPPERSVLTRRELSWTRIAKLVYISTAWYPDYNWGFSKLGPRRIALDLGKFRIRFEVYR